MMCLIRRKSPLCIKSPSCAEESLSSTVSPILMVQPLLSLYRAISVSGDLIELLLLRDELELEDADDAMLE